MPSLAKPLANIVAIATIAIAALLPGAALASERIVLIVAGAEKLIYLPAMLAQRLGYFASEGLDVQLESEPSGVGASDAMLASSAHGVVGAYDHTIDLQARGKSVQSLVLLTLAPGEVELVASRRAADVRSPADFRGRRLGVTGLGSSTSVLTQYLAFLHGLKPGEFQLVPVGSGNSFAQAMREGRVDAGMTTEPTASRLLASSDAQMLVDLRTPDATNRALGGLYPFACLYVRTDWLASHRDDAQKLANAFVRSLRFIATHSASQVAAALPQEYFGGDKANYLRTLTATKSMFTPDGAMPASGPPFVLKVLSAVNRNVQLKSVDLRLTYTNEFVSLAR